MPYRLMIDVEMEEKVAADCTWLEEWVKDHPQNVAEATTSVNSRYMFLSLSLLICISVYLMEC